MCDQRGEVRPGVLVEREITRIVSAGTVTDGQLLDAGRNHYLAAAYHHGGAKGGGAGGIGGGVVGAHDIAGFETDRRHDRDQGAS